MPSNALRQGFRQVLQDPGLLLIEIAWRWTFGAIAVLVLLLSMFVLLGSVFVDPRRLEAASALTPLQMVQTVAATLTALGGALTRVSLLAALLLTICWIFMSAFGRRATLVRPALFPGATLRTCFAVSAVRAAVTLGAILAWMLAGILAGLAGSSTRDTLPNPAVILGIGIPALLLIVTVWSVLNWYFSLAPLFPESTFPGKPGIQITTAVWDFVRSRRDELLEISVVIGIVRAVIFVAAMMLSFAVSAVITNPRVLVGDLVAVALLYFLAGDFLYMVRLVAYGNLIDPILAPTQSQTTADLTRCS